MKIAKLFLLLGVFAFTFSCSNDDDSDASTDGIVGSWKMTELDYEGTTTTAVQGVTAVADFVGTATDIDLTIQFSEDPNEYKTSGSYTILLETTVNGQTTSSTIPNTGFIGNGIWVLSGNSIIITDSNGQAQEATVVESSATSLVLEWKYVDVDTQQGATITQEVSGMYSFEKI